MSTVTPDVATFRLLSTDPFAVAGGIAFAPSAAVVRFLASIALPTTQEMWAKVAVADPGWSKPTVLRPSQLNVLALTGAAGIRLLALDPTVFTPAPCGFSLITTVNREADGASAIAAGLRVDGQRLLMVVSRAGSMELWRSDDRGATWNHYTITGMPASTAAGDIIGPFAGDLWIYSSNDDLMYRTPASNPGAGGFTTEATSGMGPLSGASAFVVTPGGVLYAIDTSALFSRTGVGTWTLHGSGGEFSGASILAMAGIPGHTDILALADPFSGDARILRITPTPLSISSFIPSSSFAEGNRPRLPFAVHDADDWWWSAEPGANPAEIYRTVNAGASWSTVAIETDFWADSGVLAGDREKGHVVGFGRQVGEDFAVIVYYNTSDPTRHLRLAKIARFDPVGGVWRVFCTNRVDDTFPIVYAGTANVPGVGTDFYCMTYDAALDNTRVYRCTVAGPGTP